MLSRYTQHRSQQRPHWHIHNRTVLTSFTMLPLETLLILICPLLVFKGKHGLPRERENIHFITITPRGAGSSGNDEEAASDVSFLCSWLWRAEKQRKTTEGGGNGNGSIILNQVLLKEMLVFVIWPFWEIRWTILYLGLHWNVLVIICIGRLIQSFSWNTKPLTIHWLFI